MPKYKITITNLKLNTEKIEYEAELPANTGYFLNESVGQAIENACDYDIEVEEVK
ncbi:hypothetical protein ACV7JQ_09120 [Globicatella sulfidifaciens]